jgi:hypothetical protein
MQCLPQFSFLSTMTSACTRLLKIHVFTDLGAFGNCRGLKCFNIKGYQDDAKFAKLPFVMGSCSYYELFTKIRQLKITGAKNSDRIVVRRIWKLHDDVIYLQMKMTKFNLKDINRPTYHNRLRQKLYGADSCYISEKLPLKDNFKDMRDKLTRDRRYEEERERAINEASHHKKVRREGEYLWRKHVANQMRNIPGGPGKPMVEYEPEPKRRPLRTRFYDNNQWRTPNRPTRSIIPPLD